MRYIELNPVRAGMVKHPKDCVWSSYHSRGMFKTKIPEETLKALIEATNKVWVFGGEKFKRKLKKVINRPAESKGRGGYRKSEVYRRNIVESVP